MAAGSITWELLMKTASFETDSKKAEKRIRDMKKEAEALGAALGVAVVAGAAAMTYALKQTVDSMDDLSKAAQKVGMTTEALSELRYAADLSDVSAEALDKSLIKLAKAAADGNTAFEAMGVSVKDGEGNLKKTDVLLAEVAGKFAGYKDGAEKTALAVEIFGKAGADLIPLLNSGADGLKTMGEEARAFGLVVSGEAGKAAEAFNDNLTRLGKVGVGITTAAIGELLPLLNTLTDEMVQGAKVGGGFGETFGGVIKTALQAVVILASDVIFVFKGIGTEIGGILAQAKALATGDFAGVGIIGDTMKRDAASARAELDAFQAKILGVGKLAADVADKAGGVTAPLVADTEAKAKAAEAAEKARIAAAKKRAQEIAAARKALEEEGRRMREAVATPSEKRDSTIGKANRLADAGVISPDTQQRSITEAEKVYQEYVQAQRDMLTKGLLAEEDEISKSYERRKQMILALTEATESEKADAIASLSEKAELDQASARLKRYRDLLSQEAVVTTDYQARRRELENDETLGAEERNQHLVSLAEKYHERMNELDAETQAKKDELFKKQIDLVSEGFAGAAALTKAFAGEQSDEYKAMFAASKAFAVADIAIKQAQAIAKAWGENNYFVAAGLTVGLAAQFATLLSSASGASFGGTRADGGSVNEGRSYLVGERGPEMFTPAAGGTIIPNDALQGGQQPAANIRIVNAFDNAVIGDYMGSSDGERLVMNAVRRNQGAIRQMVSV